MSTATELAKQVAGPRVPSEELRERPGRYILPTALLTAAAILLLVSLFFPYWGLTLLAPQYPGGLTVDVYLDHLEGDVSEIDGLNHYIGMRPLGEAAELERSLSVLAVGTTALLVVAAVLVHTRAALYLSLPAIAFPFLVIGDLAYWLRNFGRNLDPAAPLSSSVKPFVPPIFGEGVVGQFRTLAGVDVGFSLAVAAAACVLAGLWFHRRAYKPLVERVRR